MLTKYFVNAFGFASYRIASSTRYVFNRKLYTKYLPKNFVGLAVTAATAFTFPQEDQKSEISAMPENKFLQFASLEYCGIPLLTPRDFLDLLTQENPRPRIGRRSISLDDISVFSKSLPKKRNFPKNQFFRKVHTQGVIDYTDYLFLVSLLTQPKSSFEIAFKLFDRNSNGSIDINEMELLKRAFASSNTQSLNLNTTIKSYLFGQKLNDSLSYPDFCEFIESMQNEILEVEFFEVSKGAPSISEVEFAHLIFKSTNLKKDEQDAMIHNLMTKLNSCRGIYLEDFRNFSIFLNHLSDFVVAIKIFSYAGKGLGREEFSRAVKATIGYNLPLNMIETLFLLFDKNGDGRLSKSEFVGIMKDARQRGFRYHRFGYEGWNGFKHCLRQRIRSQHLN